MTVADTSGRPDARSRPDVPSLLLSGLLLVMGVTVLVDAAGVEAPPGGGVVGPAAFMWAIGGALLVLGAVLGLVALRGRPDEELAANPLVPPPPARDHDHHHSDPDQPSSGADPAAASVRVEADAAAVPAEPPPFLRARPAVRVAVLLGGLLVHAAIISTAGYIVAAAVLFVSSALAFGAPRLLPPVLIGTVLAAVIFYSFTLGLGLGLPYLGGG